MAAQISQTNPKLQEKKVTICSNMCHLFKKNDKNTTKKKIDCIFL